MSFLPRSLLVGCVLLVVVDAALNSSQEQAPARTPKASSGSQPLPGLVWHTDYLEAMTQAQDQGRMLFLFFYNGPNDPSKLSFESRSLADPEVIQRLREHVLVKLPVSAKINLEDEEIHLLSDPAFEHMHGRQGIAVVDLKHQNEDYFGRVVSAFPFSPGLYYTPEALRVIVGLPAGSITQRTMIYAVRMHPERPESTQGKTSFYLIAQAKSHSLHQANIQVQGHHNWDSRFQTITSQLPGELVAQEVCAESWPGQTLIDAAVGCVDAWRQSPGHWSAVRRYHPLFGYDIRRGRNGIWYATGIFATRRQDQ